MPGKNRRRPSVPEFIMRTVRDVPLTFLNDTGSLEQEKFSIEYKAYTAAGYVKLSEELKDQWFAGEVHIECEVLARSITAIIDSEGEALTEEDGSPANLNAAFFAGLVPEDRDAIRAAIKADANPQTPSPSAGASSSSPAGS